MNLKSVLVAASLFTVLSWAQAPASAPAPGSAALGSSKVAIVDIQTAISQTAEARKELNDLQARFQPKSTELENENKEIQSLQQKLQDGGNTLSADAKQELTRTIDRKQRDLNNSMEEARTDFNQAQQDIVQKIGAKMLQVINGFARQNGYSMIIERQAALFADNSLDVTGDVVKAYDRQYPAPAATASAPPAATPKSPATSRGSAVNRPE